MAYINTKAINRMTRNGSENSTRSRAGGTGESFEVHQIVDNTDGFISLLNLSDTIGTSTLDNLSMLEISNTGGSTAEIQLQITDYKDNSNIDEANSVDLGPGSATTTRYVTTLLRANETITLPNARWISYAEDASGANGTAIDDTDPHSISANLYTDSTADVDSATADGVVNHATATRLYLEPYTSASNCTAILFRVGDVIRVRDEVMEVTAIGDKSDLANNYLDVIRGVYGSTAGTAAADDDPVRLPFFNLHHDFNDTSTQGSGNGDGSTVRCKTNGSGVFHVKNMFGGYGRTLDNVSDGIVPGSFYMYFSDPGYQELGLTGIGSQTNSGLTSGTPYQFNITVDGGSAYSLSFTCDSVYFGGATGVIAKINAALSSAFYASSGNLKDRGVSCAITSNGDIRFTSHQRTAASAVLLADSSGSDTDIWGVGRIPAVASIESAVASRFPNLNEINKITGLTKNKDSLFAYDDGYGNIKGRATGTFNYDSGELNITSAPANAEFKIGLIHKSAHGGGNKYSTNKQNSIISVSARSVNTKWKSNIKVTARN